MEQVLLSSCMHRLWVVNAQQVIAMGPHLPWLHKAVQLGWPLRHKFLQLLLLRFRSRKSPTSECGWMTTVGGMPHF